MKYKLSTSQHLQKYDLNKHILHSTERFTVYKCCELAVKRSAPTPGLCRHSKTIVPGSNQTDIDNGK